MKNEVNKIGQMHLPLVSDGDNLTIRKLIALLEGRGLSSGLELLLEVEGDVAKLLLDVADDFTLGGGGEGVPSLGQVLDQEIGEVTTSEIKTKDGVGEGETFVDGNSVGNTITGVQNDTGGTTGGVQGKDGLDGNVEGRGVEGFEHDLGHLFTVDFGVEGGLSQQNGVLLWGDTQLVVEGVMPDLLHVVPVGDDTVLNGVLEGEDTTLGLGLVTGESPSEPTVTMPSTDYTPDVGVLLSHTDHHTLMTRATDNRSEGF